MTAPNQRFAFFVRKFDVDFLVGEDIFDRRLGIAALILILIIEGSQSSPSFDF